ncbi:MAG: tetratricopeptide repeat protein, partial [Flavobacteriales bacterium]|nr:tetratricopeptide repeat protein [Flavobacteriales bacterium]
EGEWKDGKKHGKGTYIHNDGDQYIGEWKNGQEVHEGQNNKSPEQKENDSTNDSLLVERALLNIEKGNLEEAKKDLETANLLDTTNGHTHYLLGDVLLELAKQGKGSEESVKLSSSHFKSAIKYKSDSALSFQKDGEISMYLREHLQAIELLSKSLSVDETDYQTLILLGYCYKELDQLENARYCFEKSINIETQNEEAYLQIANIYSADYDMTAIEYYKKALKINSNNRLAYYNIGLLYQNNHMYSQAQDYYHKLFENDIEDKWYVDAHYNLGFIFMENLKDYKNAINYFAEAALVNPNSFSSYFAMGHCYLSLGDVINAERYYRKSLDINPEYKDAQNALNKLLSDNEKYK